MLQLLMKVFPPVLVIEEQDEQFKSGNYNLKDYLVVLPNSSGIYPSHSIDSILSIKHKIDYQKNKHFLTPSILDEISNEHHQYWVRLNITTKLPKIDNWYLGFNHPEVHVYLFKKNEFVETLIDGTHINSPIRDLNIPAPLIPLQLQASDTLELLIHLSKKLESNKGYSSLIVTDRKLMSEEYLETYQINNLLEIAFSVGILLAIGIYHLMLFAYGRDISYLLLATSCFILTYGLGFYGELFQYLFVDFANLGVAYDYISAIFYILSPFISIPFTISFFGIKEAR